MPITSDTLGAEPPLGAGALTPTLGGHASLNVHQRAFEKALRSVQKLSQQITEIHQRADRYRPLVLATRNHLCEEIRAAELAIVKGLDQARKGKPALSHRQSEIAFEIMSFFVTTNQDHPDFKPYVAEQEDSDSSDLDPDNPFNVDDFFGSGPFDPDNPFANVALDPELAAIAEVFFDNAPEAMRATPEFARMYEEIKGRPYEPSASVRKARKPKRPTKAQLKAEAEEADAQGALREIYRRLTRAIHPDREQDPKEQDRKTELMGRVNIAYEKRDLVTLLEIQLQLDDVDVHNLRAMADSKVKSLTSALKAQIRELEQERAAASARYAQEFGLSINRLPDLDRDMDRIIVNSRERLQFRLDHYRYVHGQISSGPKAARRWLSSDGLAFSDALYF
jgi:hypothetical protein